MAQLRSNQSNEMLMDMHAGIPDTEWSQSREDQEWLGLALEAASMGAWDKNLLTGEEAWSAQSQVLFGFEPGTFDGTTATFLSRVHPDDRDGVWKSHNQALQTGRYRAEFRVIHSDATIRWIVARGKILYTPSGEPIRLIGVHIDLTERKQTEAMLRQKEVPYRRIFETITDGLMIIDLETSILVETNLATCQMHGYSYDELIGALPTAYVHPDSFPLFSEFVVAIQAGKQFHCQAMDVHKDGTCFDVEVTGTLLDYNGKPHALAIVRDISERKRLESESKQAEAALAESEAKFRCFVENASDLIYSVSADRTFTYLSPQFTQMWGYEVAEFQDQSFAPLVHPDDLPNVIAANQLLFETGEQQSGLEFRTCHKNGSWFWIVCNNSPIKDADGKVVGFQGIARDISDRKASEAALQQKEAQYRAIFESIKDGIVISELETGTVVAVNPAAYEIFGYTEEEFTQLSPAEYVHPDSLPKFSDFLETVRAGLPFFCEAVDIRKDGTLINVEVKAVPLLYGDKLHTLSLVRDISERVHLEADRKQAEAALAESEANFRRMVENANDLIYSISAEGSITYLSPQFTHLFGYEIAEFLGQSFAPLVHPDDLPIAAAAAQRLFETGENQTGTEFRHKCKDGSWRWVTCNSTPITDADGNIVGFQGIARDISEAKQLEAKRQAAEEKLKHQEQTLRAIVDNASCWIWMTDPKGKMLLVNQRFCQDVGLPESALTSVAHYSEALGIEASRGCMQSDILCLNSDRPIQGNETLQLVDGKLHAMEVIKTKLQEPSGEVTGLIGIAVDVTQQKQTEATLRDREQQLQQKAQDLETMLTELHHTQSQLIQSEKMSSLGQLVAGVAHEINNPVNFIYGNLTHANEYTQDLITLLNLYQEQYPNSAPAIQEKAHAVDLDFLTEDLPKLLSSMKVGADRIRQIVASLRNFSRMDEAEFKTVDIHEGIDSTLMILQNRLKAQPQQPEVEVIKEYADLPLIECYAGQLNQVFMNILSNALDALEEPRAQHYQEIEPVPSIIHICTEMPNPEQVVIRFKDNGPGIPEAVQKRLFDPFFTTKPVGKGTGMGLSISYQIVTEKHNGSLQCISLPNQGAEFVITIPIRQQIP